MFKYALSGCLAAFALVSGGCSQTQNPMVGSSETGKPSTSSGAATTDQVTATSVESVDLIDADWSQIQELVSQQAGKVVVVDVWSTACEPCMKEFPGLLKLQGKHPDDLVAISFDIDYVGIPSKPTTHYRPRVLNFLNGQGKSKVLHRMNTVAADDFFTQLKLDAIPAIFVYGRDGKLAKQFQGVVSPNEELSYEKHVIPLVDQLVAESKKTTPEGSN